MLPAIVKWRRGAGEVRELMKILVVEDDAVSRFMTVKALEQLGFGCTATSDGQEAWERLSTTRYDLVISDWMMPHVDGIELCRRIRAEEHRGYTYFVILTALAEREFRLTGMRAGADDYLAKPLDREELLLRLIAAERVTRLHRKLEDQALELERLNREFFESGRKDPLTGVANRRRMQEDLAAFELALRDAPRGVDGHALSVALFDIDHFKRYNDTYLHTSGDEVLRRVASVLSRHIGDHEGFYRYGGEEFLAVIRAPHTLAIAKADLMRRDVESCAIPHEANPDTRFITISAGVAPIDASGEVSFLEAIRAADEALLRAKREGRNRIVAAAFDAPPAAGTVRH
jgi:diguanylate cyclase (GGDEF)-like protein